MAIALSQNVAEYQQDCNCCTANHAEFDFWIGNWDVFNKKGEKIGENNVEVLEDHCIIAENWKGTKGGSGKSFNYYDPKNDSWNQLWISNTGNILKLKGHAEENKMILKSDLQKGKNGVFYNQITWTKNPDGSVTQLWEILDPEGATVQKAFEGIYRKK